jgi:putative ABC transport system permease protein
VNLPEAVRTGYLEISSHKMRSFLSFAAIACGVAAILYTFAEVHEMFRKNREAMTLAGPGRMRVKPNESQTRQEKRGLSPGLTMTDAEAIRSALPDLYMIAPGVHRWNVQFRYGALTQGIRVYGVVPEWAKRDWAYTPRGRIFNSEDIRQAARVCVLVEAGDWSDPEHKPFWARWWKDDEYDKFMRRTDVLGRTVQLNGQLFTVIGVLKNPPKDKDPRWFTRAFAEAFVPLTTAQRYLMEGGSESRPLDGLDVIEIDSGSEETLGPVKRRVETIMASLHRGENDFEVEDFREEIRGQLYEMRKHAVAILSVGIIAILAGGVGIMNVTLATIFSRIREIGIRRAVGATRSDILVQFVIEAMMLGLLGGVAGILLGLAGLRWLGTEGQDKIRSLQAWHFLATLAISAGAGFLFSLYPAHQASKLDPVEALRYE